jgi:integrase
MCLDQDKPVPSYRRHRQSGQAIVTLTDPFGNRRDVCLGKYGTQSSRIEYARVIAEWEATGRRVLISPSSDLTIAELMVAFWPWAEKHYRLPDGTPSKEVQDFKMSLRPLKHLYAETAAKDFGPLALKAVRGLLMQGYDHPKYGRQPGLSRGVVNQRIGRIKRMFRWASENELIPAANYHGLLSVRGLQRGRTEARETQAVRPIARAVVEETLPLLRPIVADMVQLQLETGMRSGGLVIMRATDIEMAGKVWLYRPCRHKTEHHGHARTVALGPKAQEIVQRYLKTDLQAYLFSPAESVVAFRMEQRQVRKSKVPPSQQCRRKHQPTKQPGERYTAASYCRAIYEGCDRAFPPPEHLQRQVGENGKRETAKAFQARLTLQQREELRDWRKSHRWHPHQLRHTRATELRRECGLDVARTVLGHRSSNVTEVYAEADTLKASEAMARLG